MGSKIGQGRDCTLITLFQSRRAGKAASGVWLTSKLSASDATCEKVTGTARITGSRNVLLGV